MENQIPTGSALKTFELPGLIDAAQRVALLRMRPAIAAHRSRAYISHSLRIDVLNRLGGYKLAPFEKGPSRTKGSTETSPDTQQLPRPGPSMDARSARGGTEAKINRASLEDLSKSAGVRRPGQVCALAEPQAEIETINGAPLCLSNCDAPYAALRFPRPIEYRLGPFSR